MLHSRVVPFLYVGKLDKFVSSWKVHVCSFVQPSVNTSCMFSRPSIREHIFAWSSIRKQISLHASSIHLLMNLSFFMCWSLFSPSNPVSHQVQSPPSDLEPPDPTTFAHFARLTYSTVSTCWAVFFSLIWQTHVVRWMESLIFTQIHLPPKGASDILLVLECGTRLSV